MSLESRFIVELQLRFSEKLTTHIDPHIAVVFNKRNHKLSRGRIIIMVFIIATYINLDV